MGSGIGGEPTRETASTIAPGMPAPRPARLECMDALVIGPPDALADAVARALRRSGMTALRALAADARDRERATWLLDEAGHPPLVVVLESAPFAVAHELLALTGAHVVLVAEQRATVARAGAPRSRSLLPRDEPGLTRRAARPRGAALVRARTAGARSRSGAERAAALVLRACGAEAASCR